MKPGRQRPLLEAIQRGTLGQGSVAEGEYLRNMGDARELPGGDVRWVEVCYCPTPLEEERPYWEEFFELVKVQDAHDRRKCRDWNGTEAWNGGEAGRGGVPGSRWASGAGLSDGCAVSMSPG